MRVGQIGAGNNGANHARGLAKMEDVQVVGIADPEPARGAPVAEELGATHYLDHREMLAKSKPDLVCVSSPCWMHADHAIAAAEAGAHVLCEKPMALTLEDCDHMIAAVKKAGVKLMVTQTTRYIPALLEVKKVFDSGRCGELVCAWSVRMGYHHVFPHARWRLDGDKSGGIVFEWEIHEIDFVRSIGGDPTEVYARTAYSRPDCPNFLDHFAATLTFAKGGYGTLDASQSCLLSRGGRGFVGTRGAARTDGEGVRLRTLDADEDEIIEVTSNASNMFVQDSDFVRAIREDAPSPVSGEDARVNIEIGLAIIESGKTGEPVRIGQS